MIDDNRESIRVVHSVFFFLLIFRNREEHSLFDAKSSDCSPLLSMILAVASDSIKGMDSDRIDGIVTRNNRRRHRDHIEHELDGHQFARDNRSRSRPCHRTNSNRTDRTPTRGHVLPHVCRLRSLADSSAIVNNTSTNRYHRIKCQ
jgi:hypothetical protein